MTVLEQLADQTIGLLTQPSTISYFAYEPGDVIGDIRNGQISHGIQHLWRDTISIKCT